MTTVSLILSLLALALATTKQLRAEVQSPWKRQMGLFGTASYMQSNLSPHRLDFASLRRLLGPLLMRENFILREDGSDAIELLRARGGFSDRGSAISSLFRHNEREIEEAFPSGCTFALLDAVLNPATYGPGHRSLLAMNFKPLVAVIEDYAENYKTPVWRYLPYPRVAGCVRAADSIQISRPARELYQNNRIIADITSDFFLKLLRESEGILDFQFDGGRLFHFDIERLQFFQVDDSQLPRAISKIEPQPRLRRMLTYSPFSPGFAASALLTSSRIYAKCGIEEILLWGLKSSSSLSSSSSSSDESMAYVIALPSAYGNPCAIRFVESESPKKIFLLAENAEGMKGFVIENGKVVLDEKGEPLQARLSRAWRSSVYSCFLCDGGISQRLFNVRATVIEENGEDVIAPLTVHAPFEDLRNVSIDAGDYNLSTRRNRYRYLLVDSCDSEIVDLFTRACSGPFEVVHFEGQPTTKMQAFSSICEKLSQGDLYSALEMADLFLSGIDYHSGHMQPVEEAIAAVLRGEDDILKISRPRFNFPK